MALTDQDRQRIVHAYEGWTGSVDSLASQLGVSKQTIYAVLKKEGVPDKRTRLAAPANPGSMALAEGMAREALNTLIEELVRSRIEVRRLQGILAAHGIEEAQT